MTWETVIGLESHVELVTKTKIFCSCTTEFVGAPNTHYGLVCTGMPGTLPVVNKKVVEFAAKAGLALNCEITRCNKFDRKNYFYSDLHKTYHVSQLYLPIARNGRVSIQTGLGEKDIRIHALHMEEDAGKLVHDPWIDQTKRDYNRCGAPHRDHHGTRLLLCQRGHRLSGETEIHAGVPGGLGLQDAGGIPAL